MLHAAWRSLLARKVRLLMSTFAIVLGVAFVVGSLTFTDTLGRALTGIMNGTIGDVMVRPAGAQTDNSRRTVPAAALTAVRSVPGVAAAKGEITTYSAFVLDRNGKPIGPGGAPAIGTNFSTIRAAHDSPGLTLTEGRAPHGKAEITLDPHTAASGGYRVGDTVSVLTGGPQPRVRATVVGLAKFSGGGMIGATLVTFDTPSATALFQGGRDVYQSIWVEADPGVSQQVLRDRIAKVLPSGSEAVTGDVAAKEAASEIQQGLGFIDTFLLVFAGIALVVGAFLIVNTFSMLVAQRSRELALLRALGARRTQITGSVLFEALVVGFVGSTLGVGLGLLLAIGIKAVFGRLGLDLSGTPLVFAPQTVLLGYVLGIVITAVAAYFPARRAGTVPPVAALRDDVALPERALRLRFVLGIAVAAVSAALLVWCTLGDPPQANYVLAAGMLGVLLAAIMVSPVLLRPVIRTVGLLYRALWRTIGQIAEQNSLRNPRRTAATASALMIGLTLVSMMSVFGESAKASVGQVIKDNFTGDYVISAQYGRPIDTSIGTRAAKVPGVEQVVRLRFVPSAKVGSQQVLLAGIDPAGFKRIVRFDMAGGSIDALRADTVVLLDTEAKTLGVGVGSTVPVSYGGVERRMQVVGLFRSSPAMRAQAYVTMGTFATLQGGAATQDNYLYVVRSPGADPAAVHAGLDAVVKDLPIVTVADQGEFAAAQAEPIDQLLRIIYALLGLAIVIAVMGIVNTLALSVVERTREIGLLRAVAFTRPQVRRMIRLEAVLISLLGALLGIVVGVLLGWVLQRTQTDKGVVALVIPWGRLALFVALAAVIGVLAAWWPARRASRLDVLRAIATD